MPPSRSPTMRGKLGERQLDVVHGEDDGGGAFADQLQHGPGLQRVDGGHRLVPEDDVAAAVHGAADRDPLLLPSREVADPVEHLLLHAEGGEDRTDLPDLLAPRPDEIQQVGRGRALVEAADVDVVEGRQLRHQRVVLVDERALLLAQFVQLFQQGGLADTAGADDDDLLPGADAQGEAGQDRRLPVRNAQVFEVVHGSLRDCGITGIIPRRCRWRSRSREWTRTSSCPRR